MIVLPLARLIVWSVWMFDDYSAILAQALFARRSPLPRGFVGDDGAAELTPVAHLAGSFSPRWRRGARADFNCCYGRHASVVASAAALGQR